MDEKHFIDALILFLCVRMGVCVCVVLSLGCLLLSESIRFVHNEIEWFGHSTAVAVILLCLFSSLSLSLLFILLDFAIEAVFACSFADISNQIKAWLFTFLVVDVITGAVLLLSQFQERFEVSHSIVK